MAFYLAEDAMRYLATFNGPTLARLLLSYVPFHRMTSSRLENAREVASFGSGSSTHEAILALCYPDMRVHCYDSSSAYLPKQTQELLEKLPNFEFHEIDANGEFTNQLQNRFDLLFSIQTFEHIREMDAALRSAAACVKEGGFFYVDTPQFHEQPEREPEFARLAENAWEKHSHYHLGFSRLRMMKRLEILDFDIIDSGYYAYFCADGALLEFARKTLPRSLDGVEAVEHILRSFDRALAFAEKGFKPLHREIDELPVSRRVASAIRVLAVRKPISPRG